MVTKERERHRKESESHKSRKERETHTHIHKGEREREREREREKEKERERLPVTDLLDFLSDELSPVGDQEHHTLGQLALQMNPTRRGTVSTEEHHVYDRAKQTQVSRKINKCSSRKRV